MESKSKLSDSLEITNIELNKELEREQQKKKQKLNHYEKVLEEFASAKEGTTEELEHTLNRFYEDEIAERKEIIEQISKTVQVMLQNCN